MPPVVYQYKPQTPINSYQQNDVLTASPAQLIGMLYDEALRSLDRASEGFEINDPSSYEIVGNNLIHTQEVLTELVISLDFERGGEIALNLKRIYEFCNGHLSTANIEHRIEPIRDVRSILVELREAWREVIKKEMETAVDTSAAASPSFASPIQRGRISITG
ncbi:MAG: flagellar export chaperone FliS [Spartobacteria bacterium]|nr:flagellar export chaperone FliS [Spartobacteria bacterium]